MVEADTLCGQAPAAAAPAPAPSPTPSPFSTPPASAQALYQDGYQWEMSNYQSSQEYLPNQGQGESWCQGYVAPNVYEGLGTSLGYYMPSPITSSDPVVQGCMAAMASVGGPTS
jgi:hypothetical protein